MYPIKQYSVRIRVAAAARPIGAENDCKTLTKASGYKIVKVNRNERSRHEEEWSPRRTININGSNCRVT